LVLDSGKARSLANRLLLYASGTMAIIGGLLMFLGGVTAHSLALWILPMLNEEVLTRLPTSTQTGAILAIDFIAALVSLGGVAVVFGGASLLLGRRSIGRVLIALGGGAGIIGLLLALGYSVLVSGLTSVSGHAGYWAGVVLAVVARRLAAKG
jgi:hypothetical protein